MGLDFSGIKKRLECPDESLPEHQYEYWVKKTADLIKRPYFVTHVLLTKEKLPLEGIIARYEESTKHGGDLTPEKYWWWRRKLRKQQHDT